MNENGPMLLMLMATCLIAAVAESRRQIIVCCGPHIKINASTATFVSFGLGRNIRLRVPPLHSTSRRNEAISTSNRRRQSRTESRRGSLRCNDFAPSVRSRIRDLASHPAVVWDESSTFASMHKKKLGRRHLPLFDRRSRDSSLDEDDDRGDEAIVSLGDDDSHDRAFDEFARAVCRAGVVARKEVFETWASALYIHSSFLSGGGAHDGGGARRIRRVADIAAGHGLLAWALLILDDDEQRRRGATAHVGGWALSSRPLTVLCLDKVMPRSAEKIHSSMVETWPHLEERFDYVEGRLEQLVPADSCLLASVHACGILSDILVATAAEHSVPLSLVPCCHSRKLKVIEVASPHAKDLYEDIILNTSGSIPDLADRLDEVRMRVLENSGMDVREVFLPNIFTGMNRLIMGFPSRTTRTEHSPRNNTPGRERKRPATPARRGRMPSLDEGTPGAVMPKPRFLRGFHVPCEDTEAGRRRASELSGREAAVARKEVMRNRNHEKSPRLDLSLWLPPGEYDAGDGDLSEDSLSRIVESEHDVRCSVSRVGAVYVDPSSGRRARTFRIRYGSPDEREVISFRDAKAMHERLYREIPEVFPGAECR